MACFSPIWLARLARGAVALGLLSYARAVVAQTPADPAPTARGLFDEGRALMLSKDYASACPKFEQSQRLDPGGGTLLNLAVCNELLGKTATAWAEFREGLRVAQQDKRPDRVEFAEQHIAALLPRLSRVRFIIPAETRVPGLTIKCNGVELGEASWGEAIPVDPGEHACGLVAPGKISKQFTMVVGPDADTKELRIEPLNDEVVPVSAVTLPQVHTAVSSRPNPVRAERSQSSPRTQRWLGGIISGTGLAALGVASYLGLHAISLNHAADRDCPDQDNCKSQGILESRSAVRYSSASTLTAVGGALLVGAGAYVFLSTSKPNSVRASVRLGPTGTEVKLSGDF